MGELKRKLLQGRKSPVELRWRAYAKRQGTGALGYGQFGHADRTTCLFFEFLNLTDLWARWRDSCPLHYVSPNVPSKANVLGTWILNWWSLFIRLADPDARREIINSRPWLIFSY
jgi:hypothetical protein